MKRQRADAPLSPNPRSPTTSSSSALQTSNEQQQQLHLQGGGKVLVMPGFPGDNHVPKSEMYRIGVVLPPYSERDKYVWLHVGRARTKIVNCALLKFLIPLLPGGLMSATVKVSDVVCVCVCGGWGVGGWGWVGGGVVQHVVQETHDK